MTFASMMPNLFRGRAATEPEPQGHGFDLSNITVGPINAAHDDVEGWTVDPERHAREIFAFGVLVGVYWTYPLPRREKVSVVGDDPRMAAILADWVVIHEAEEARKQIARHNQYLAWAEADRKARAAAMWDEINAKIGE